MRTIAKCAANGDFQVDREYYAAVASEIFDELSPKVDALLKDADRSKVILLPEFGWCRVYPLKEQP